MKETPPKAPPLYSLTDQELLHRSIANYYTREALSGMEVLTSIEQQGKASAMRLRTKAQGQLNEFFQSTEQLFASIPAEASQQIANNLAVEWSKRERSRQGLIGSLVRNGHITSDAVGVDGKINTDKLSQTPYFIENPFLSTVIAGHEFGRKSKTRKVAESLKKDEPVALASTRKDDKSKNLSKFIRAGIAAGVVAGLLQSLSMLDDNNPTNSAYVAAANSDDCPTPTPKGKKSADVSDNDDAMNALWKCIPVTPSPSKTPKPYPTETQKPPTKTAPPTATERPTKTPKATETATRIPATNTPTKEATPTPSKTPKATETSTPARPTDTAIPTETQRPPANTLTPTFTLTPISHDTPTATMTEIIKKTFTPTPTEVSTNTPTATATKTEQPPATATRRPRRTPTATATEVIVQPPPPTATPTETQEVPSPTATSTSVIEAPTPIATQPPAPPTEATQPPARETETPAPVVPTQPFIPEQPKAPPKAGDGISDSVFDQLQYKINVWKVNVRSFFGF